MSNLTIIFVDEFCGYQSCYGGETQCDQELSDVADVFCRVRSQDLKVQLYNEGCDLSTVLVLISSLLTFSTSKLTR